MKITIAEPLGIHKDKVLEKIEQFKEKGLELEYYDTKFEDSKTLYERLKNSDIAVIANSKFYDEALEKLNNLKYISIAFTGFDHINVGLAKKMGIKLSNSRSYSDICVSELVIGQVLNIYRKLNEFEVYKGNEICGKTVLIVGYGNIGQKTQKLFEAFGAKVIYHDPYKEGSVDLIEGMKIADIVSLHMPVNEKTKNMINKDNLKYMKESAILINCARGGVLNTKDLIDAVENRKIRAAALDVFDVEPPLPKDHIVLNKKNIFLTAHIAFLTEESMLRRFEICTNNVLEYVKGNIINEI